MKNFTHTLSGSLGEIKKKFLKRKSSDFSMSTKEKIHFLDQLSNLLLSGIPLINAIQIINYQTKDTKIKNFLSQIKEELNQGTPLKDILRSYKKVFHSFDISIIEMGEVTGNLGDAIETIKQKEEKSKELKGKIIGALIYPSVIIGLSIVMIIVFMVYVIPKIQAMYQDAKVNLPALTQTIIDISVFLQHNYLILIALFFGIGFLLNLFRKHEKTKIYYDRFVLNIPLFGKLIQGKILSLFSANLGTLLRNGIIINEALKISSNALENAYYEKRLHHINEEVAKGHELSGLMGINKIQTGKEDPLFPIALSSVVKIGEETGKLAELLEKVSIKFNKEIDESIKNLQTAIEPTVIIGVGLIIGTIIMAIMLPFFNMVQVL